MGEPRPFNIICQAEARHIEALLGLFVGFRLIVPAKKWPGNVERYASLQAACEAGVTAAIANGQMYEQLLAQTQNNGIITVLRHLQEAS